MNEKSRLLMFLVVCTLAGAPLLAATTKPDSDSRQKFRERFEQIRPQVQKAVAEGKDVAIGFASSMEKILPRFDSIPPRVESRVHVELARNERESFQVVVLPRQHDLRQVRVRIGDLHGTDGTVFAGKQIDTVVMGYVKTTTEPPYGTPHVGWWPDPILNFQQTADIAAGDAQAFWIRVHASKKQKHGVYRGKLTITSRERPLFTFDLAVRVYDFDLPDVSPLPLAITFSPQDHPQPETRAEQAGWQKDADYPVHAWKKHKLRWADFLADYYITYDSLYGRNAPFPDFEVVQYLQHQGRLDRFNLGYYGPCGDDPDAVNPRKANTLVRLQKAYDTARAENVLDHAYIYGCDEAKKKAFPGVQRAAAMLKAAFPDVLIMSTTYDSTYGQDSVIHAVDAWCPLTPKFDRDQAAQARANGKQVWWYICCGPRHPYANMFIEYPAIEGRLLMGAMTAKYRPDGFLYYQISIWNSRRPIEHGPFTDWNPRSWTTFHGDGSWTCVGPDGLPLPTIRLENFRDGLEDYAYVRILEATIAKVEANAGLKRKSAKWLKTAQALLEVPPNVVKSLTEYTHDPANVYAYRQRLAGAIEDAGVSPAYPWSKSRK